MDYRVVDHEIRDAQLFTLNDSKFLFKAITRKIKSSDWTKGDPMIAEIRN